jgi:hypothetical protein
MDDVYFIIATSIFGIFVIFFIWLLYKYLKTSNTIVLDVTHLSEEEKDILATHCSEMRRARIGLEKQLK